MSISTLNCLVFLILVSVVIGDYHVAEEPDDDYSETDVELIVSSATTAIRTPTTRATPTITLTNTPPKREK